MSSNERSYSSGRLVLVMLLVDFTGLIAFGRLVQMQVFQREKYVQLALKQHERDRAILAPRGVIYDSQMDELATNVTVSTVVAEPRKIKDACTAAETLASLLKADKREIVARMTDPATRKFLVVQRRIDPNLEPAIQALQIQGVYLVDESMRFYPNQQLASHALGFVNWDGEGVAGLEKEYDSDLEGTPGRIIFNVDTRGHPLRGKVEVPPVQGRSLVLSIDRTVQYVAERELKAGVEKSRAAAGVAIVMESDTGRILALANYPGVSRHTAYGYRPELWRNRAIQDVFEPGSTLKVVVSAAALETGVCRPDELIDCQMGSMALAGHVFHDHKPFGLLTFMQVLENSSNIGAAKLGMRLGKERLYAALINFGFGSPTGIDLPAERAGLVRNCSDWSALSVASISFGQEIGVTSMQILAAINAVANGGFKVRPSVVDRVIDEKGNLIRSRSLERIRIMRPETAAAVSDAFEGVVLRGTGRRAALDGYRAAGKTGTAQKAEGGRFSRSKYVASFVGFAPLPSPRVTILVQIDEPRNAIYGGDTAAPVFQKIAQETLVRLHVSPEGILAKNIPRTGPLKAVQ